MAVTELKDAEFAERLQQTPLAVVSYHVGRDADCILFKPVFVRLSAEYPAVTFFVADLQHAPMAHEAARPQDLPWFELFSHGRSLGTLSTRQERDFRAWLERHLPRP